MLLSQSGQVGLVGNVVFFQIAVEFGNFGLTPLVDLDLALSLVVRLFQTLGQFFQFSGEIAAALFGFGSCGAFIFVFFFELLDSRVQLGDLIFISSGELVVLELGLFGFFLDLRNLLIN